MEILGGDHSRYGKPTVQGSSAMAEKTLRDACFTAICKICENCVFELDIGGL